MVRKHKLKTKKKGLFDVIIGMATLILLIMTVLIGFKVMKTFKTGLTIEPDIPDDAKDIITEQTAKYPLIMDNAIFILFIFVVVASLISSFLIDVHPIFFIVAIVLVFVSTFIFIIINNSFETIVANVYSSEIADFPKASWMLDNFILILTLWYFAVAIVMYGKVRLA